MAMLSCKFRHESAGQVLSGCRFVTKSHEESRSVACKGSVAWLPGRRKQGQLLAKEATCRRSGLTQLDEMSQSTPWTTWPSGSWRPGKDTCANMDGSISAPIVEAWLGLPGRRPSASSMLWARWLRDDMNANNVSLEPVESVCRLRRWSPGPL